MTAAVEWGPEIRVDGKRPAWMRDGDTFSWYGCTYRGTSHDWEGVYSIRLPTDHPYYAKPAATPNIAPALVERMVALVRDMAKSEPVNLARDAVWEAPDYKEARAIAAELPQPVDPDLVEARKLAAAFSDREDVSHSDYLDGSLDSGGEVQGFLAALKRGRALAAAECGLSGGEVGK